MCRCQRGHGVSEQLGTLVRRLRNSAKLTQRQLAEAAEISERTVRRLEKGDPVDHRMKTVALVATALRVGEEERAQLLALAAGETAPAPPPTAPARHRPLPLHPELTDAANRLARELRHRWQNEEDHRRIHDPFPLPVRWRAAPAGLGDRPENVQRLGPGAAPAELDLGGDIAGIAALYRSVPSGRLAIVGRAGSGKSVLAVRLVLDLLAADPLATGAEQIPVVLRLSSWDPADLALSDWMESQLLADHPDLARRAPGESCTLAAALIRSDALLPVLDGFDEIGEGLRARALEALNETQRPLVLTSRRGELAEAVEAVHAPLLGAAVVELADLTPEDLRHYLPRTSRTSHAGTPGTPDGWETLLPELHRPETEAGRRLARVLSTPLMVTLARTLYSDSPDRPAPAELLDETRFPTAQALEDHLLAGFVPALYRRRSPAARWDAPTAHRWLAALARHLGRPDRPDRPDRSDRPDRQHGELAWWRLPDLLPRSTRTLAVGLAAFLFVTVPACTLGLLFDLTATEVVVQGLLVGLAAGFAFAAAYAVTLAVNHGESWKPTYARLRWPRGGGAARARSPRAVAVHLGGLFLGSFLLGAGCAVASSTQWYLFDDVPLANPRIRDTALANMTLFGLTFATATTAVFGLLAALEAPMDTASAATPGSLLAANRSTVSRQAVLLFPLFGLAVSAGGAGWVALLQGTFGPYDWGLQRAVTIGAIGSVSAVPAYVLGFTAWGQWVLLVRIWLPLTGRLPWDTIAFLDDAYRRGALRQAGAVYQFRHLRLQHHLSRELASDVRVRS
ncbi:helix-turn-helix domain-containing protein [Kitasatospora sp. NPDC051170]|uniref:helix-turn-helix domain-containing protein n=1 Tax=Kitasatospora sp. NPDC051170 TaxID=3364056 RepID=UPI0037BBF4D0